MSTPWTDERVERLTTLLAAGHSASVIAGIMGTTRNAVIGKVHRDGLERTGAVQRGGAPKRTPRKRAPSAPRALSPAKPVLKLVPPAPAPEPSGPVGGISFEEIHGRDDDGVMHHRYAWPLDMPKDAEPIADRFCGGERKPGRPYCEAHCARAYIKRRTKAEILSTANLAPSPQRYAFGG